ncbi:hypothetical protein OsI_15366 [Oryza sativa Indica Group]|uniref:Uncharacterized protein n=1 Tax=Oryza sativa subsp. indica TaxID=39946 RepID=A2XRX1_ORYSI|nr:hypothetical protein OsI_15366 [Oryza sativa Indica Group]
MGTWSAPTTVPASRGSGGYVALRLCRVRSTDGGHGGEDNDNTDLKNDKDDGASLGSDQSGHIHCLGNWEGRNHHRRAREQRRCPRRHREGPYPLSAGTLAMTTTAVAPGVATTMAALGGLDPLLTGTGAAYDCGSLGWSLDGRILRHSVERRQHP